MKHAIYGKLEFQNGVTIDWLRFVEPSFTKPEAEKEAVRIVIAQHKGDGIKKCWVTNKDAYKNG